jgi:hypothetical protein
MYLEQLSKIVEEPVTVDIIYSRSVQCVMSFKENSQCLLFKLTTTTYCRSSLRDLMWNHKFDVLFC